LAKKSKENTPVSKTATKINILLIVGALAITSGIIWYALKGPAQTVQREVLPKPNVTTLDPAIFTGKARSAYEAAKEVPEVLAQLPCFCGCMTGFGHKNNLDCFHDEHGVECSMCQDIALDARDMYKNGFEIVRIRQLIKEKYGRYASLSQ
jgi:hypothetical protein